MIANTDDGVPRRSQAKFARRPHFSLARPPVEGVDSAMEATRRFLLDSQRPDGYWVGELEGDTILESEYVLLMAFLGRHAEENCVRLCKYIHEHQLPSGGWSIYPGGPNDLSASVKAYFALKLCGMSVDHPSMVRARKLILEHGGAQACNSFTRFYLALLGQISHADCPTVPPEILLLPKRTPFGLYAMSSWTRTMVVTLSVISARKPVKTLPQGLDIAELFRDDLPMHPGHWSKPTVSWANFFVVVDKAMKWAERVAPESWRKPALRAAHRWMLDHCENTDGLGAIFPPMVYSVIALLCLGYEKNSALVLWALEKLDELLIEDDEAGTVRVQPCLSPTWDTAITTIALADAGLAGFHPSLLASVRWLLNKESRRPGDWHVRSPGVEPTGWFFQYRNESYPDIDDTAMVVLALGKTALADDPDVIAASRRAVAWILSLQNRDGGWAAYDVDIDNQILTKVPFADHNAMLDPSCADITARVVELLGELGHRDDHPAVSRALDYLWRTQEPEGCWYGRWGVNYIYGTWQVLLGLRAVGIGSDHPAIVRAADWLESVQQSGGSWGESCASYDDIAWMGRGNPTASQTAWALMGLIAAGRAHSEAVHRGISYLVETQLADGTWDEGEFTGTGFPRVFYLKYHLYRVNFPLMALGRYQSAVGKALQPQANPGVLATRIPALPLAREM